jgi:alpha-1,6-mannosyltransferase
MTVCDLTHAYTPTSGGIRTYIDAKRQYVLDHTDDTHVLVIPGRESRVTRGDRWSVVRVRSPLIPGAAPYRMFTRPGVLAEALARVEPDVVELNTYYMPPEAAVAYRYRRARRASGRASAVAVSFHTDFSRAYAGAYSAKVVGDRLGAGVEWLAERYVRARLRPSDLVFAFSPPQQQRLVDLGVENAARVPLGADLARFHPSHRDDALRTSLGVGPDDVLLFYAGRFDSEKHVETLVDAVEALPEAPRTVLAMAGDGPLRPLLHARAERTARLRLLPFQEDRDRLARWLASADVYVTAGPHETYGLSVIEAEASGLPVVGVRAGGLIDHVPPGVGLLGPVDDAHAMAYNIQEAVARRATMGAAARRHTEETYSWRSCFDALFALYRPLVGADTPALVLALS